MARRVRRVSRSKGGSRLKAAREIAEKQAVTEADRAVGDVDAAASEADAISAAKGGPRGMPAFDEEIVLGRQAYESVLKTNVAADYAKFEKLRSEGAKDTFDRSASVSDVERAGPIGAASHVIRLVDAMILDGADRETQIESVSKFLAGFSRYDVVRKVLIELESKPIRDIYPLEVMLHLLETAPNVIPGVALGPVVTNAEDFVDGGEVFAGHPVQLHLPKDVRVKHFAPLDGVRMGYEFFPSPDDAKYTLLIDTPGLWELALFAAPTEQFGRMTKESPGGTVDIFPVNVVEMGRKSA